MGADGRIRRFVEDEDGATMIEYGLIVALVSVALFAVAGSLGDSVNQFFSSAATKVDNASGGGE